MKNYEIPKRKDVGFSLVEAVIALAITIVILGVGLMIIKSMMDSNVSATSVYEVNADNQAALNVIRRDLQKVGRFDIAAIRNGIPLPVDSSNPDAWGNNRCFDTEGNMTNSDCTNPGKNEMLLFKGTNNDLRGFIDDGYVLDVVTPGIVNGHDAVSILYIDDSAQIGPGGSVLIGTDGKVVVGIDAQLSGGYQTSSGTLTSSAANGFKAIREGDFIYLAQSNILQYVSKVDGTGNIVTISDGPETSVSDTANFNETVYLLRRVTYYMESAPSEASPAWLMRQVNLNSPSRVVSGITNFKLTYDILNVSPDGTRGVLEVDISPDVSGAWAADESYSTYSASKTGAVSDKDFFNVNPFRTLNIARVNVNVLTDTGIAGLENTQTVKIDQTARIAVHGFLAPGTPPTPPGPDPDPDPCELDPGAPGCENVITAGCAVNSSEKGMLCNTPCKNNDSVGKPTDNCKVYYFKADDANYDCAANWEDIGWLQVTQSGNPHAENSSRNQQFDIGVSTEIKNFPQVGYYCVRIQNFFEQPGKIYISEKPFYMK